jgi:hypothetical protein
MIQTEYLNELIDEKVIENAEINDACDAAVDWTREKPRTYGELRKENPSWMIWLTQNTTLNYVLEKLSTDTYSDVRRGVAQNAATPVAVLEKLSTDTYSYVRRVAKRRLAAGMQDHG